MSRVTRSSSISQHSSSLYTLVPVSSTSRLDDTSLTKKSSHTPSASLEARRKHQCSSCPRAFTTSGHLSRHMRIHTGERNHHCPFPGCDVKCSRQDNLQQHYRIHLARGTRRTTSAKVLLAQALHGDVDRLPSKRITRSSHHRSDSLESSVASSSARPSPPLSPPPLEQARVYTLTPPDSPPPLVQATLPATFQHLESSPRSEHSTSTYSSYSSLDGGILSSSGAYHSQPQGFGFGYTDSPTSSISSSSERPSYSAYSGHHEEYEPSVGGRGVSPFSLQGKEFVSQHQRTGSFIAPPSPSSSHSTSSQTSSPTLNHSTFNDSLQGYHRTAGISNSQFGLYGAYQPQDFSLRQDTHYIYQPQPVTGDYTYNPTFMMA
ncbi:hypothetical protein BKA70DRAFT_1289897 [Coprinopsis sp. MPI-PUGE-AT-0042]|nr:hypothetical protein BKA70DRAFT_1289897 [Coprinopsis sp. MPI-PUGE-AT-0042]